MRHRLPSETKRLLIEALVFLHVRYCISVWGSCTTAHKNRVKQVIHFGARIVTRLGRREHFTPVLREHYMSVMRHLMTASNSSEILRDQIVTRSTVSARRTRATDGGQLQIPRVKTEFARRGFLYRAVSRWNKVPQADRS